MGAIGDAYKNKEPDVCLVCGAPAVTSKPSFMGGLLFGLCTEHQDYVPYIEFGPQFMQNVRMGVMK